MKVEQIDLERVIQRYETVHFRVERRLHVLLRQCVEDDLTVEQSMVLRYIGRHDKVTSTEISEVFCIGKSAVTSLTNRLVEKKYVQRIPDPDDRRIVYLSLTEQGHHMREKLNENMVQMLSSFLCHFSQEEAEVFLKIYEKLADVIERN